MALQIISKQGADRPTPNNNKPKRTISLDPSLTDSAVSMYHWSETGCKNKNKQGINKIMVICPGPGSHK